MYTDSLDAEILYRLVMTIDVGVEDLGPPHDEENVVKIVKAFWKENIKKFDLTRAEANIMFNEKINL